MSSGGHYRSIRQHDLEPPVIAVLSETLVDGSEQIIDLTGAISVKFQMRKPNELPKVDRTASVTNPSGGTVQYNWSPGDTDTLGKYEQVWKIEVTAGRWRSVPQPHFNTIEVLDDVEDVS